MLGTHPAAFHDICSRTDPHRGFRHAPRSTTLVLFLLGLLLATIGPRMASGGGEAEAPERRCFGSMSAPTRRRPMPGSTSSSSTLPADASRNPRWSRRAPNPSFLALHPRRPLLYAISEVSEFGTKKGGFVSAYAIQAEDRATRSAQSTIQREVRDLAMSVSIVAGSWCWWPTTAAAPWPACPSGRTEV